MLSTNNFQSSLKTRLRRLVESLVSLLPFLKDHCTYNCTNHNTKQST